MHLIGKRLVRMVPLLLIVTFAVFALSLLLPGDPAVAIAGEDASPEQVEVVRTELGLDRPVHVQYASWLGDAVTGDLGASLYRKVPVTDLLWARLPATFAVAAAAFVVSVVIGVTVGIAAAAKRGSWIDRLATVGVTAGLAMPNFWLAMVLIIIFARELGWFPMVGYTGPTESITGWLHSVTLPAISLGLVGAAQLARFARASMIEVLDRDHIRTANAMGLGRASVLWRHGLKNASIPVVTVAGYQVAILLGGSVIIEQIFAIPGLGTLAINSVQSRDLPVVQGIVLLSASVVVVANLLTDLAYGFLDPKVRVS